jgi:hypothetical protein
MQYKEEARKVLNDSRVTHLSKALGAIEKRNKLY